MKKKVLSIVLAIMMVLSVLPLAGLSALAAEDVKPVAKWEEVKVPGLDYAVKYTYENYGSEKFLDWYVDFTVQADKYVPVNAVEVTGMYGEEEASYCNDFPLEANTPYQLIASVGKTLSYGELVSEVESFTCGIKDVNLEADTKFTINIALTDPKTGESFTVEGGEVNEILYIKPEAKCEVIPAEKLEAAGLDYAVEYTIAKPGSDYYNDWEVEIFIVPDKDVKAGDITLKGQYTGTDLEEMEAFPMTAGVPVDILKELAKELGEDFAVTYEGLAKIQPFACGIKNNGLAQDTEFTVYITLSDPVTGETFTVEGSEVKDPVTAEKTAPVAEVKKIDVDGLDEAAEFTIKTPASPYYNDWTADIVISANKDVNKGDVTLKGNYGEYVWEEFDEFDMTAGQEISLLNEFGDGAVTYEFLANKVGTFGCGIVNNTLAADTKFTLKVVLTSPDGKESFTVDGSAYDATVDADKTAPVAKYEVLSAEKLAELGLDYAVSYSIDKAGSAYYNDWEAKIYIVSDKDVKAGDITLKGQYTGTDLEEMEAFPMTAGVPVDVLKELAKELGEDFAVTYEGLAKIQPFACGIKNNGLAQDTEFTVYITLNNTKTGETFTVEGSEVKDPVTAEKTAPVAEVKKIDVDGLDEAAEFTIKTPASPYYNDWTADIVISANKDVKAGDVTLKGNYGEYVWEEFDEFDMTAGQEISLLNEFGDGAVTYEFLANKVGTFGCGIVNNALAADTKFTLKVVLTSPDGKETFTVDGSSYDATIDAEKTAPVAEVKKIYVDGLDEAAEFTIKTPASPYYNDWTADIVISANKDVNKGDVTLKGNYGEYVWEEFDEFDMTAGQEISLLNEFGDGAVTYEFLANKVGTFGCGIVNNALAADTKFTLKVVLTSPDGKETFTVDGSAYDATIDAEKTAPVAEVKKIDVDGLDEAAEFTIKTPASPYYNDWTADIVISANKDVKAGDVTLKGNYGEYVWEEFDEFDMTAGQEISLLNEFGDGAVTYEFLANKVGTFGCGIVNNALTADTKFTLKVVLTSPDGKESFTVDGSAYDATVDVEKTAPVVEVKKIDVDGLDEAAEFTIKTPASPYYNDWTADIVISADKDVNAGDVTLKGNYGEYVWEEFDEFDMTAGQEISLLNEFGDGAVTYEFLANKVGTFGCGIVNNALTADTKFTLKVVLTSPDGKETLIVDGSTYDATITGTLSAYIADALKALDEKIANEVPDVTQEYDPFINKVAELKEAITNAVDEADVDEKLEQALKVIDNDYVPERFVVTVDEASGATVKQTLNPSKSTKYEIATVKIKESNGVRASDGYWFVYWVDEDGRIVSTYSTYNFFAVKNTKLTPVYVSKTAYAGEREKGIIVTDIVETRDNRDGTATLFAERSVSKVAVGNEITQHGIIWTTDESQKYNLTIDNEEDYVYNYSATRTSADLTGLFKINVKPEEGNTIYAVSYVTDANGITHYSEEIREITLDTSVSTDSISCGTIETVLEQADEIIHIVAETEPEIEAAPSFMSVLKNIINVVTALLQSIIALF